MKYTCLACGRQSDNKKEFFEVSGHAGLRLICKDCAAEVGIKNFVSAGFTSNTAVLKKYVKLHPEAQSRLDQHLEIRKSKIKSEIKHLTVDAVKYSGCQKKKQTKCTCSSCGNVFYYTDSDVLKNAGNLMIGNIYTLNQVKNLSQCPKCGSAAVSKKDVFFWVDKKGNCVDVEE